MSDTEIDIEVVGDSSLFTALGKGVTYLLRAGEAEYLIDCGATPFRALGPERLGRLRGLIGTHSHEDHRRWFTDLVLYMHYSLDAAKRLRLITSEAIHEEFEKNSRGALERSLSADSRFVVDVPYKTFVEQVVMGPRAKYRTRQVQEAGGEGRTWRVVDTASGRPVPPSLAKVFVHPEGNRPRMLFKDPESGLWVEPESYYPFSSTLFYEPDRNDYVDPDAALRIRAVKAMAWHGPPTIALLFERGDPGEAERVAFSSDTVFDPDLWEELAEMKLDRKLDVPHVMSTREAGPPRRASDEFEGAPFLYADINRYVQRQWSRERYEEAVRAFGGLIVFHDADFERSVVHTSYSKLVKGAGWKRLLLNHTPDSFVSTHPITVTGKRYRVTGGKIYEVVDGQLFPLDADAYWKQPDGGVLVGYASPEGRARLWETEKGLRVVKDPEAEPKDPTTGAPLRGARPIGRYDLYVDIGGRYFPAPNSPEESYVARPDGLVELVRRTAEGSSGRVVQSVRGKLGA